MGKKYSFHLNSTKVKHQNIIKVRSKFPGIIKTIRTIYSCIVVSQNWRGYQRRNMKFNAATLVMPSFHDNGSFYPEHSTDTVRQNFLAPDNKSRYSVTATVIPAAFMTTILLIKGWKTLIEKDCKLVLYFSFT